MKFIAWFANAVKYHSLLLDHYECYQLMFSMVVSAWYGIWMGDLKERVKHSGQKLYKSDITNFNQVLI